ncbi:MAG: hypothetical protein ACLFV7_04125 [Phycisphaerae bacterium]
MTRSANRGRILFAAGLCVAGGLAMAAFFAGGPVSLQSVAWADSGGGGKIKGLHLPRKKSISFRSSGYALTDGDGYLWQFQYCGNVYQGTNWAYSYGLYSQIFGNNIHANNHSGWSGKNENEFEIGPCQINQLQCYRRIKVYKDRGLCRWLDILHNTSAQPITTQVQVYSSFNYGIGSLKTNTGGSSIGQKDYGFVTTPRHNNNTVPSVMHITNGLKSKLRPSVQNQGNSLYVRYDVTIPAGETIILCYFEAQNRSTQELTKRLEKFDHRKLLKDLPMSVRKLIVNFDAGWGFEGMSLERSDIDDTGMLVNGDELHGRVTNEQFTIRTFFGDVVLPAEQVVGMQAVGSEESSMLTQLVDGQVLCGTVPDQKLEMTIAGGGRLDIPFDRMKQWSFQVTKDRPDEIPFQGPFLALRSGDRLAFDAKSVDLSFRTRYGLMQLVPEDLLYVQLDNSGNTIHRVAYLNGSSLGGFLQPQKIGATLRLCDNKRINVSRDLISHIEFADEEKEDPSLSHALLTNGDELYGEMDASGVILRTDYGDVPLKPSNIKIIGFSPRHLGRTVVVLWNRTVLRGQLGQDSVNFRIAGGPKINLYPNQCLSIVRSHTLPQAKIVKRVEQLVAQLGGEAYLDREAATEELKKLGPGARPLVEKFYKHSRDPEIRQRLEDVLETLQGKEATVENSTPDVHQVEELMIRGAVHGLGG